ncbi:MAG: PHP domain-containing protein [Gemmatimonadales bacterium]
MKQRHALARLAVPLGLTVLLLCARLFSSPALSDPVAGAAPPSLRLAVPWLYLALAPLFTMWDGVSMLSMARLQGFLIGLVGLYLAWRIARLLWSKRAPVSGAKPGSAILKEIRILAVSLLLLAAFLGGGAVWHRPMLALTGADPRDMVVDFHSHTNVSHDVRNTLMRGFDTKANLRWHTRAGFDATFITDHNEVSRESGAGSRELRKRNEGGATVSCPGIEVSAWRAHIVLLGDTLPVDRTRYNGSLDELLTLLATSDSALGALSVASLPEYRRNHWSQLDRLVAGGLDGFEVVNASPKANELPRAERDSVIALARAHNRFVVGVSDTHGWGATSMVWNLVHLPTGGRSDACPAILNTLRTGFPAVSIIERHRLRPDSWWPLWLTPIGVVWETWRGMGWALTAAWLVWIWLWGLRPRRTTRSPAARLAGS